MPFMAWLVEPPVGAAPEGMAPEGIMPDGMVPVGMAPLPAGADVEAPAAKAKRVDVTRKRDMAIDKTQSQVRWEAKTHDRLAAYMTLSLERAERKTICKLDPHPGNDKVSRSIYIKSTRRSAGQAKEKSGIEGDRKETASGSDSARANLRERGNGRAG